MSYLASYITALVVIVSIQISVASSKIKQDAETYMGAIKAKKVSEQILSAPFAKECAKTSEIEEGENGLDFADQAKKDEYEKCISKAIDNISNEDIKTVSNKMNLKAYDKKAAKSATSIKEYLQKRLHKAITGVDPDDKEELLKSFADKKVVDHNLFYQLYAEQIGKNSILHVSRYCLENFGGPKPNDVLVIGDFQSFLPLVKEAPNKGTFENIAPDENIIKTTLMTYPKVTPPAAATKSLWSGKDRLVREYEVCTLPTDEQCKRKFTVFKADGKTKKFVKDYRHVNYIEAIKNAEFLSAELTNNTDIISERYGFCVGNLIPNMCKLYKCQNVYDSNSSDEDQKYCDKTFGIKLQGSPTKSGSSGLSRNLNKEANALDVEGSDRTKRTGHIACNVQNRLREYKKVLVKVKELQDSLVNGKAPQTTIAELQSHLRVRGKGADNINIGKVTTISSTEIGSGVEEFKNAEDNAKELEEKCMDLSDPTNIKLLPNATEISECQPLLANLNKEGFDNIDMAEQAQAALKLKEIDNTQNKKELEEFLKRNNLSEYIKKGELSEDDLNKLKTKVAQEYKAKKMALVASLQEKFNTEANLRKADGDENIEKINTKFKDDIAQQSISDIKEHKKRVETLIQYSNIVSSYMTFKDKNDPGKDMGKNTVGLNAEINNKKEDDQYLKYFSSESNDGGYGNVGYLEFIDGVIGNVTEKDEATKP
jgi:hypothetical protein